MISLAVLDIAGTTVDVTDGVPDALIRAFGEHGLTVSPAQVQAVRGISKRDAIRALLGAVAPDGADAGLAEGILIRFRSNLGEWYRAHPIAPLPGAAEAIRELKRRGVAVWLATGFDRELGQEVVRRAGLAELIDGLATDDDVERGRPAPDLIRFAMARSGVNDPGRVVAVGDTCADLDAAAAAGVGCAVGVLSGAHDQERLSPRPHDLLLPGIGELPEALARLGHLFPSPA